MIIKNKKNRITKKNKKSNKSNKSNKISKSQSGGLPRDNSRTSTGTNVSVKYKGDSPLKTIPEALETQPTQEALETKTTQEASTPQQPTENTSTPQQPTENTSTPQQPTENTSTTDDDGVPINTVDNPDLYQSVSASPLDECQYALNQARYGNYYFVQELNRLNGELSKFTRDAPPELQVKSAGEVPFIDPQNLFVQINDIGVVDKNKLDTRLIHVATLTRKEPFLRANTENSFYKFNVTPPPGEKMFTAYLQNRPVEIPFPASLFLRYRKQGNALSLHGVYVVDQDTVMRARMHPYEVDLTGLVKLETEKQYNQRIKKSKPIKMISGAVSDFDAKIVGHQVNMTFPNPDRTQIENLEKAIKGELLSATGSKSNYLLTRFNITDIRIQNAYEALKYATSRGDSNPSDTGKTVANVAITAVKAGAKSVFNRLFMAGGKRRKNIKYKTKKMKYKKNKNRKTRVRMK